MRLLIFLAFVCLASANRYNASWSDLDTRPIPSWFDKAKIGIFLHWGVYSVPSYAPEWFWHKWKGGDRDVRNFMKSNYPEGFTYQEFAPMFKAELFDPNSWADLFVKAGAKYVVLQSKHHDGFALFPSKRSFGWNSVDVGPKKDLVGELSKAVKNKNLKFGFHYSLYEWYNPIYNEDKNNRYRTQTYVENKVLPELKQLVEDYKPSLACVTGDWEASSTYWKSPEFISWLYNESPVKDEVIVNDQWGKHINGYHGDVYDNDYRSDRDRYSEHKWQLSFKLDKQCWGYRRNMAIDDILTTDEIIKEVVSTVSTGGNVLINIGPTKEGTIDLIFQERLLALGSWLSINGEAIYGSSPWYYQKDSYNENIWYTCVRKVYNTANPSAIATESDEINAIYATFLKWPVKDILRLKDMATLLEDNKYKIEILGNEGEYLPINIVYDEVKIKLPQKSTLKSEHAWTLKFTLK